MKDKVTRQCPQTTTFEEKLRRAAEVDSNLGPSAYQPNALLLGQTGSQMDPKRFRVYISIYSPPPPPLLPTNHQDPVFVRPILEYSMLSLLSCTQRHYTIHCSISDVPNTNNISTTTTTTNLNTVFLLFSINNVLKRNVGISADADKRCQSGPADTLV